MRDDRVMTFDLRDRTHVVMFCGTYESAETRMVRDHLKTGDVFVDIGAHVGWFAVLAARTVGPTGSVFAFEPYPPSAEMLRENIRLNSLSNVQLFESGAGDATGIAEVAEIAESETGSVTIGLGTEGEKFEVPINRLDSMLPPGCAPKLIKVDVEGYEQKVIKGGLQVFRDADAVVIEIHQQALRRHGSSETAVLDALRSAGFATFREFPSGRAFGRTSEGQKNVLASR